MSGAVFFETLRRSWRGMFMWGVGLGLMAWIQVIIVPDVESLKKMAELMETLPKWMMDAFGGADIEYMATPEGYLTLQWFSWFVLILSIYAVMAGLNVTANEEDRGIMDVLLSLPLPRWRIIVEKFTAYSLLIVGIVALTWLGLWLGGLMTPSMAIDTGKLLVSSFNALPSTLVILAFTIFSAVLLRRRGTAIAIASIFVIASYFVDVLGRAVTNEAVNAVRAFSFFTYYDSVAVMKNGLVWNNVIILSFVTILLIGSGVWLFQRRDVGV
jgi:ABC-2 type transport system permease protein